MPYVMRGRTESLIVHEARYDITTTRSWLRAFNRARPVQAATLFHLVLWACGFAVHQRPKMNRFVSGGRFYQRTDVWLSFAAKRTFERDAPLVTIKIRFPVPDEPFGRFVRRVAEEIARARGQEQREVDRELVLFTRLPHPLLRAAAALYRIGDRMNLLPGRLIDNDPMYTTVFVANLGSVGLDHTWHHLYENGTCGVFATVGGQRKMSFVDRSGALAVRDGVEIRYSFDERIIDAHYCASSLEIFRQILEDPQSRLGQPERAAQGAGAST